MADLTRSHKYPPVGRHLWLVNSVSGCLNFGYVAVGGVPLMPGMYR